LFDGDDLAAHSFSDSALYKSDSAIVSGLADKSRNFSEALGDLDLVSLSKSPAVAAKRPTNWSAFLSPGLFECFIRAPALRI
jgi:hypothetical protein